MEQSLPGRVALVTGASEGIGLGIARLLAEAGTAVAMFPATPTSCAVPH